MNLSCLKVLTRSPWRTLASCLLLILFFLIGYWIWSPGEQIANGRHDRKQNGIWVQHGWLGDDAWFKRNNRDPLKFRNSSAVLQLRHLLLENHITDVYPHMAPCLRSGSLPAIDSAQTRQFLSIMNGFRVMPWVGGVLGVHALPNSPEWRDRFADSVQKLLTTFPEFAGIHLNIEPLPSGHSGYLQLLQALRKRLPTHSVLSIAAYPPPTIFQRRSEVHWDEDYFKRVAAMADQLVVMMYDTGLRYQKLYRHLMRSWTREIIQWAGKTKILLGIPAYEDESVSYHHSNVENLVNSIMGIHAALASYSELPAHYQGIAIYSEWEMTPEKWNFFQKYFLKF